jgi:hypothetical protein
MEAEHIPEFEQALSDMGFACKLKNHLNGVDYYYMPFPDDKRYGGKDPRGFIVGIQHLFTRDNLVSKRASIDLRISRDGYDGISVYLKHVDGIEDIREVYDILMQNSDFR